MWHLIIVFGSFVAFALTVGFVVWCIVRASQRAPDQHSAASLHSPPLLERQLAELHDLKDRAVITEAEYELRRSALLQQR